MKKTARLTGKLYWLNWRFLLTLLGLSLFYLWYATRSMPPSSYSAFMNFYDGNASASSTALAFGLDDPKQYADLDAVYQAYISANGPFFYRKSITNGGPAVFFIVMVLSLWVINHAMHGSACRNLLMQGCRRLPVCAGLLLTYLLSVLLCCGCGLAVTLLTRPIDYAMLSEAYLRRSLVCWVLFTVEAAALLAVPAFTLKMTWAILTDLGLLVLLSILRPLRALVSPAILSADELWEAEGFSLSAGSAIPVAAVIIILSAVSMAAVFRRKDFSP